MSAEAGYKPVDLEEARRNLHLYQNNGAEEEYAHRLADFAHVAVRQLDCLRAHVAGLENTEGREARIERVDEALFHLYAPNGEPERNEDVQWIIKRSDHIRAVQPGFVELNQSVSGFMRHVLFGDGVLPNPEEG